MLCKSVVVDSQQAISAAVGQFWVENKNPEPVRLLINNALTTAFVRSAENSNPISTGAFQSKMHFSVETERFMKYR